MYTMAAISRRIFTTVILATQLVSVIDAAPLLPEAGRWVHPCGGSSPATDWALPPVPIIIGPITEEIQYLVKESRKAVIISGEIVEIIKGTFSLDTLVHAIDQNPPFTGFPEIATPPIENMTVEDFLFREMTRISSVGVFLEQCIADGNYGYTELLKELQSKYVDMLCKMEQILSSKDRQTPEAVSRSIMPDQYRVNLDTQEAYSISRQHQRNYIIVRDAKAIFKSFGEAANVFSSYSSSSTSSSSSSSSSSSIISSTTTS